MCCRLRRVDEHDQQKGLEFCWNGYFDDVEKSNDSHSSQWRSVGEWRGHSLCQIIGYILDTENPRRYVSRESFARITDMHMSGPMIEDHVSFKTVFTYNFIRKPTYRSRSPGLSTTSSSSSSSDSSSPTSSSQERTDSKPIPASIECESADEQARDNPSSNPTKIPKHNKDMTIPSTGRPVIFRNTWIAARIQEGILWMKEFLNSETHTRVLLANHLSVAENNGIGQTTQYLYSFLERPNLRNLSED